MNRNGPKAGGGGRPADREGRAHGLRRRRAAPAAAGKPDPAFP